MGKPADRDETYMRQAHGTSRLITDYGALEHAQRDMKQYDEALKRLVDPALIRNEDDYDDWDYGAEPIPGDHTWIKKPNS
jgi:hypothetical protein